MIQSVRIQYYKAIQDSGALRLPAFAVFIGNNGSGKSSVFEALQLLHEAVVSDINQAFNRWGGLENVRNHRAKYERPRKTKTDYWEEYATVEIRLTCRIDQKTYRYQVGFNTGSNEDIYLVKYESLHVNKVEVFSSNLQDNEGYSDATYKLNEQEAKLKAMVGLNDPNVLRYRANRLFVAILIPDLPDECRIFYEYVVGWQFLALNAQTMGLPVPLNRLTSEIRLLPDGRNLAEYIRQLARDPERLNGLVEKMKFVLPYASDIQTQTTEDFDRKIQLRLLEEGQRTPVPGWLFSSGTLRILAILAVMQSPKPPTALLIDEVENGLDPRTIGLLINEIQQQYAAQRTQVVVTTHSPYFLDLVPLESILVSEKSTEDGTYFHLPKDEQSLDIWRKKFPPGKLYTMGKLTE